MLDSHSHILPGIDDGAKEFEESVEMARMYVDAGYDSVIATPHYYKGRYTSTRHQNFEILRHLESLLEEQQIPLQVYLGNELFYDVGLENLLKDDTISPLGNSNYVLTEFPMIGSNPRISEFAYSMQLAGYILILAHVERYQFVQENPEVLIPYIQKGSIMQMNLDSIQSESKRIRDCAKYLLDSKMIHVVATDSHSTTWRNPNSKTALNELQKMIDEDYYSEIVIQNPYRIIENKRIITREPQVNKVKKSFFSKLFNR